MHVYVINLARRPDRRAFMQQQADRLGLQFDYIDAVDARTDAPDIQRTRTATGAQKLRSALDELRALPRQLVLCGKLLVLLVTGRAEGRVLTFRR